MKKISKEQRTMVLKVLLEGTGVNATSRITGVNKRTVLRLLADAGRLCADYHDLMVRNLTCKRIQIDEIWSFVGCKQKQKDAGGIGDGDCWTWVAIDAQTKLIVSYYVGLRDSECGNKFVKDISERVVERVQITSDGLGVYVDAIRTAFKGFVDFAQLIKTFGSPIANDTKYSPAECVGCKRIAISGRPEPRHISTSFVERQNLSLRMENRRFTRLTLGYSKKWANHAHAVALHYFNYNFIRAHTTLCKDYEEKDITPAIAAGITDKPWTVADLVELLETEEKRLAKGGRINKESCP